MMKILGISGAVALGVALLAGIGSMVAGCGLRRPEPQAAMGSSALAERDDGADRPLAMRVGGDLETTSEFSNGEFRSGACRISTPLPEGYPPPTPPDAIEIKRYPLVRRAEIGGTMTPDWGMSFAFFPLFNHIKRREIAMTSPVEVNYEGLGAEGSQKPDSWTMSFLYRTPQLGPSGMDPKDDRILIEDVPPMTVVAIGMRGPYKLKLVNNCILRIRAWLSQQSEWEEAGEPRALFYNGPEASSREKWAEIQIPIRRR